MQQQSKALSPEEFVHEVSVAFPQSTQREKQRLVEHARAWATVYYGGYVPTLLADRIHKLEVQCRF